MAHSEHMLYDFAAYMQGAKDCAAGRRNRGLTTGKAAKGHNRQASNYAPIERGSFAELVARTLGHWNAACTGAIEQYRFDTFGTVIDDWSEGLS